jgi:ParB-like chromosome segregation protein Spo0J
VVFQTDHKYLLADGFRRWAAATRKGWEYIEAEVKQGTYEEASEYAIYANLKHGKPLTREEYKNAVRRLKILHPDWGTYKLSQVVMRSEKFIETVTRVDEARRSNPAMAGLEGRVTLEIARAPKEYWGEIAAAAQTQHLTVEQTAQKVRQIKAEPHRVEEILKPSVKEKPHETPADKIVPLNQEIQRLSDMLDPSLYDWQGGRGLIPHTLNGLYVLAKKVTDMIQHLEGLKGKS